MARDTIPTLLSPEILIPQKTCGDDLFRLARVLLAIRDMRGDSVSVVPGMGETDRLDTAGHLWASEPGKTKLFVAGVNPNENTFRQITEGQVRTNYNLPAASPGLVVI